MFRKQATAYPDLSVDLRDPSVDWKPGILDTFSYPADVTSFAVLPSSLLAIGTAHGSIYIVGNPGVEIELRLDEPSPVKFLQFAPLSHHLVCADVACQLHVWDLMAPMRPKMVSNTLFPYQINALTLSPSHNHVFVGLDFTGDVRTFDLECLRKSPYTISNLWKSYAQKLSASRISDEPLDPSRGYILDIVLHPRDLNLLFVVYLGGTILYNLNDKAISRVYELSIIPGAPGGMGYHCKNIMTHRQPGVTSFAVHPTGHFFVMGHDDGCMSFWMLEDEDKPILVRTLDDMDVDRINTERLDDVLSSKHHEEPSGLREPIYKLAWSGFSGSSDPRGGETSLAILGGLDCPGNGVTTLWLSPFNPPDPPAHFLAAPQQYWRNAIRESLSPVRSYFYTAMAIVQDFFLVPRDTLHFAGTFDPLAIVFLLEMPTKIRACDAYMYPPSLFNTSMETVKQDAIPEPQDALAETLQEMSLRNDPPRVGLPLVLGMTSSGLVDGNIFTLDQNEYASLKALSLNTSGEFPLHGGAAWFDEARSLDLTLSKYQPPRVLVTKHRDLSVQFHDLTATLLVGSKVLPLQADFPQAMPKLTINIGQLLSNPSLEMPSLGSCVILDVLFAPEAQEVAVILNAGTALLFRIPSNTSILGEEPIDLELTLFDPAVTEYSVFAPFFSISRSETEVTAGSLSDVGFIATAFEDGSLLIVDMRGPRVVYNKRPQATDKRQSIFHMHKADDPFVSLNWVVCGVENDPKLALRLIAMSSKQSFMFTLSRTPDNLWAVLLDPTPIQAVDDPLKNGSYVFDLKTGKTVKGNRTLFARSLNGQLDTNTCAWLSVGSREAKCVVNMTGDRISKADWPSKAGAAIQSQIVERLGSHALVICTDKNEILAYSLPHLELINRFPSPVNTRCVSIDTSGDLISWMKDPKTSATGEAIYATMFNLRRIANCPKYVDLAISRTSIFNPPLPVPLGPTSLVGSWFSKLTENTTSGGQIDILLGGPDRPILTTRYDEPGNIEDSSRSADDSQDTMYDRLTSAVSERGQRLGELEDHFNALQEGAQSMVTQAKRLAATQAGKSRFGF